MRDIELFAKLLELESPWRVAGVTPDFGKKEITIEVVWPEGQRAHCPICDAECGIYDHRNERIWRHLDTMQFKTFIAAEVPRVSCSEHGVHTIKTPWADDKTRFTVLFERMAIDILLNAQSQKQAMALLGLSWDEVHHIMERAVKRGECRRSLLGISQLGIDEKSFRKGQDYASILYDIQKGTVIDLVRGRTEEAATKLFKSLPESTIFCVDAIAMDMWQGYVNAAEKTFPNADIVHDKYHISAYLNKAVNQVRFEEMRSLKGIEDNPLKGSRFTLLKNSENWTDDEQKQLREIQAAEMNSARAWGIKEAFKHFWDYKYEGSALKYFKWWFWWATHSRLEPLRKVAHMINDRIDHVISYIEHRVTNAAAEGINSKIQVIKSSARGFRNFENYRTAILFHCGGLDMHPGRGL
jgi:transposase